MMKKHIAILVFSLTLLSAPCLWQTTAQAQSDAELDAFTSENISVTGELLKVKMSASPQNPWEELALKDANGKLYILMGSAVGNLLSATGKTAVITGFTKPAMRVQGKPCTVIEVVKFELAETKKN